MTWDWAEYSRLEYFLLRLICSNLLLLSEFGLLYIYWGEKSNIINTQGNDVTPALYFFHFEATAGHLDVANPFIPSTGV